MEAVGDYLTDPDRNLSDYMAIWLLAALIEAPRLTPSLEQYVRHTHRDRNVHRELRIMAANVAGAHGNQGDADSIERTVRTDVDPTINAILDNTSRYLR